MGNVAVASCCASKVVRVVHPNGRVYIYSQPISIAELLLAYPHHYVCDIRERSNPRGGKMLPLEMELEVDHTYLLVPLPRLFHKMPDANHSQSSSCIPSILCLQGQGGCQGFPALSDSDDEDERAVERRRKGRVTLGSLLALESGCTCLIKRSWQVQDASRSPTTVQMQRILETAEMHWRYMCQGNRAWRPELESIKEEARKSVSSSPAHDLSLVEHHQPLIGSYSVNALIVAPTGSFQR